MGFLGGAVVKNRGPVRHVWYICFNHFFIRMWASLVAQWLRIRLPMQGTWVQALVREDPTCCGATKPVHHNY